MIYLSFSYFLSSELSNILNFLPSLDSITSPTLNFSLLAYELYVVALPELLEPHDEQFVFFPAIIIFVQRSENYDILYILNYLNLYFFVMPTIWASTLNFSFEWRRVHQRCCLRIFCLLEIVPS